MIHEAEWLTDGIVARLRAALPARLAAIDAAAASHQGMPVVAAAQVYAGAMPLQPVLPAVEVVVPDDETSGMSVGATHGDIQALAFVACHVAHPDRETMYRWATRYNRAVRECLHGPGYCAPGTVVTRMRASTRQGVDGSRQVDSLVTVGLVALTVEWSAPLTADL